MLGCKDERIDSHLYIIRTVGQFVGFNEGCFVGFFDGCCVGFLVGFRCE